jgi:hypothetical protein
VLPRESGRLSGERRKRPHIEDDCQTSELSQEAGSRHYQEQAKDCCDQDDLGPKHLGHIHLFRLGWLREQPGSP